MKDGRRSVLEFLGVPGGLVHPLRKPHLFAPLDFTMYPGQAFNIGLAPIIQRVAHLGRDTVPLEKSGKFNFGPPAFSLAFRSYVLSLLQCQPLVVMETMEKMEFINHHFHQFHYFPRANGLIS